MRRYGVSLALAALTFLTALWAQLPTERGLGYLDGKLVALQSPELLLRGSLFAGALMAILLVHEAGHLLAARRLGVRQSPPYFLPAPTLVGTLGAIILVDHTAPDRRALLSIALAGPLAGLLVALPLTAWGLALSEPVAVAQLHQDAPYAVGTSLIFEGLAHAFGQETTLLQLHPFAFAGWVGIFLTALNLIPASQLDGGHIAYALLAGNQRLFSSIVVLGLIAIGITVGISTGQPASGALWIVWGVVLLLLGVGHPATADRRRSPPLTQRLVAALTFGIFVLAFVPQPVAIVDLQAVRQGRTYLVPPSSVVAQAAASRDQP